MTETRHVLARPQPAHFGPICGWWSATARCQLLLLLLCLLLCLRQPASAQVPDLETWTGVAGDGLWSNGDNWSPPTNAGGPNGNFDVVIPHINGVPGPVLDVSTSIVDLEIDANAGLSITNDSNLTITGTTINNNGQLAIVDVGSAKGGLITIANTVTLSGNGTLFLDTSGGFVAIQGSGTLINQQRINGEGGGGIGVNLQNEGPNGLVTGSGSSKQLVISGAVTNSGLISGVGNTTIVFSENITVQNAGGTIDAGPGRIWLETCTIVGGTVGSASSNGSPTLNGVTVTGTYDVTSTATLARKTVLTGTITNNGNIVVTSPPGEKAATLSVPGDVTLQGTGQVTLSGTNASIAGGGFLTNVSPHIINGGNITVARVANESQISNLVTIAVKALNNNGGTITAPTTINGGSVTGGTIVAPVSPGVTLTGGSIFSGVTFTGGTQGIINVVNGTLDGLTAPNAIQATMEINDNGKLTLEGPVTVTSPGEIFLDALQSPSSVVVDGSVTISGTGEIDTSNSPNNDIIGEAGKNNSLLIDVPTVNYQGAIGDGTTMNVTIGAPTTVTNGGYPLIFNVGSNHTFNNLGTLVEGDSTIQVLGNFKNYNTTTGTLTGGAYTLGGTLLFNNANVVTNAAKLSLTGNGQIVNQNGISGLTNLSTTTSKGLFALSGEQNFEPGGTYTNLGTSIISANSFFTVGGTSTNYNQSGTTAVTTVDGRLTVPAGGLTNITGGTLQGSGQFDGDVSVGNATGGAVATFILGDSRKSSALATMSNNYTQRATGVMDVQIGGTTAGTQYSQLSVTGNVTIGGTLNVTLINKFKAVSGEQFTIINAPSGVIGKFVTTHLPANFQLVYNPTSVELQVQ